MIETKSAIENLEAILDVPGIAGVYIGPSDLGLSYGLEPKLNRNEPEILKAYEKIVRECGKRGIFPGIHTSGAADAANCIEMGFRLVTLMNDSGMMATFARNCVADTRKAAKGRA
jgi:4-hydroxy-2-oxoheptanedioate aldolase